MIVLCKPVDVDVKLQRPPCVNLSTVSFMAVPGLKIAFEHWHVTATDC